MKLLLDESLPAELAEDLRAAGHEVETVADSALRGVPDTLLMRAVHRDRPILLTMDAGIADTRRFPPEQYAGLIVFRPPLAGRAAVRALVNRVLPDLLASAPAGRVITVTG